jgi:hypothetical protein
MRCVVGNLDRPVAVNGNSRSFDSLGSRPLRMTIHKMEHTNKKVGPEEYWSGRILTATAE